MSILVRTGNGINDVTWKDKLTAGDKVFLKSQQWVTTATGGSYECLHRTGGGTSDVAYSVEKLGFSAADLQTNFPLRKIQHSSYYLGAMRRIYVGAGNGHTGYDWSSSSNPSYEDNKITCPRFSHTASGEADVKRSDCYYIYVFPSKQPPADYIDGIKSVTIDGTTYTLNGKAQYFSNVNPLGMTASAVLIPFATTVDLNLTGGFTINFA